MHVYIWKNAFRSLKYFLPQEAPFPGHYRGKPHFPVFYCLGFRPGWGSLNCMYCMNCIQEQRVVTLLSHFC